MPDIPALVLKASANFDSDDLEAVVKRWTGLAPAILVIEDLDWLLKAVNVSTLLNSLDGISTSAQGMLLIATTNHPDRLDPAINNRPGRFDVSIEMPNPDRALRESFFQSRLAHLPAEISIMTAGLCEGLSFAHLQECCGCQACWPSMQDAVSAPVRTCGWPPTSCRRRTKPR